MGLEQTINEQIKKAMLAKDEITLRTARSVKAAILLAKTSEGAGGELKEEDEIKMLQKMVKQRKDALAIYQQQNRADLAKIEQDEIEVIERFLPRQLDPQELKERLSKIIEETGARSPADLGKVMGIASKQLAGLADGKSISTAAKELLAG